MSSDENRTEPLDSSRDYRADSSGAADTAELPAERTDAAPHRKKKRRAPWVIGAIVVVVLIGAVVAADVLARHFAQQRVEAELAERLPEGSGPVTVRIVGGSFLIQYLMGSFDRVEIDAPRIAVAETTVEASIVAHGVPVDRSQPVREATGRFTLTEDALGDLATPIGAVSGLELGDGVVGYRGEVPIFGFVIEFTAELEPVVEGDRVLFRAQNVEIAGGGATVDLDTVFPDLSRLEFPVCAAEFLPVGVELTDVEIADDELHLDVRGTSLRLTADAFSEMGSCD